MSSVINLKVNKCEGFNFIELIEEFESYDDYLNVCKVADIFDASLFYGEDEIIQGLSLEEFEGES